MCQAAHSQPWRCSRSRSLSEAAPGPSSPLQFAICYSELNLGGKAYWVLDHACAPEAISTRYIGQAFPGCGEPRPAAAR